MLDEAFKPYAEAVVKILNGEAVSDLEDIRTACNYEFNRKGPTKERYDHNWIFGSIASFAASAENRILQGEDPNVVYGSLSKPPEKERAEMRKRLEQLVKSFDL